MFDWINENFWLFFLIMIVILAALIGVLLFLRSRRPED
jgi:putative exporter of polyketide antibiotics